VDVPDGVTVAVSVTVSPKVAGLGAAESRVRVASSTVTGALPDAGAYPRTAPSKVWAPVDPTTGVAGVEK
jgi:hypothetical protein